MATKQNQCVRCGAALVLRQEAQTLECASCKAVIWVRPMYNSGHPKDPISHAANKVKRFISTISNNVNSIIVASANNNNRPMLVPSGYGNYYSQPIEQPRLMASLGSAKGKKRAVLCGVSYYGTKFRLKGSVNDIKCMKYFLVEKFGFSGDSVLVLTEEEKDPYRIPTKQNILTALRWLVQGCQYGDSLVFHYSGHGSQQLDINHDEIDGYDETLMPVDHQTAGIIVDDDINDLIVRPLPCGAKLHAIIDACHSGTTLDLPYLCRMNRDGQYKWEDQTRVAAIQKGTSGGLAISLGACDDHQNAVDTTAPEMGSLIRDRGSMTILQSLSMNTSTGALTYSFIQAAQNEPGITYGRLLNAMRHTIREAPKPTFLNGPIVSIVRNIINPLISQEPQLTSSKKFDVYSTKFAI